MDKNMGVNMVRELLKKGREIAKLQRCMNKMSLSITGKYFIEQCLFEDCYGTRATAGTIYDQVLKLKETNTRHR